MRNVLAEVFWANWGSWDGGHRLAFWDPSMGRPSHVVVTGESGAGKSTLVDGLTHLTQPGSVRYNQSAKRAGKGRQGDRRTTFDYVVGRYGEEVVAGGTRRGLTLRDRTRACVTYFGATWADMDDPTRAVTACLFSFVPANGGEGDLSECYVITDSGLDPNVGVAAIGAGPLSASVLKGTYPGAAVWPDREKGKYLAELRARLGTNAEAMRISDRILSGTTPSVVDDLFHQFVFKDPEAPRRASEAIATFDRYDREWRSYAETRERIERLEELAENVASWEEATSEASLIERAVRKDGTRPLDRWLWRLDASYVADGLASERSSLAQATSEIEDLEDSESRADAAFNKALRALQTSDAMKVPDWRGRRAEAERRAAEAASYRDQTEPLVSALGSAMPASQEAWRRLQSWVASEDAAWEDADSKAQEAEDAAVADVTRAKDAASAIQREVDAYRDHRTNVTPQMMQARAALARAVGLDEDEMPYVAELVDAKPGEDRWRRAINDALAPITQIILVDTHDIGTTDEFRRRAEAAERTLRRRVRWEYVDTRTREAHEERQGHVSGVTDVDESSPFAEHVRHMVSERVTDYGLAADVSDLARPDMILPSGQTSSRRGGSIGRSGGVIIGFTAQTALEDAKARLDEAWRVLSDARRAQAAARKAHNDLRQAHELRGRVSRIRWADIDPVPHEAEAKRLASLIERAEADDAIRALEEDYEGAKAARDEAVSRRKGAEKAAVSIQDVISRLERRQKALASRGQAAGIDADVESYLSSQFAEFESNRSGAGGWRLSLPDAQGSAPIDGLRVTFMKRLQKRARDLEGTADGLKTKARSEMVAYFKANPDSGLPGTDFDHDRRSYLDELDMLRKQQLERPEALSERRLVAETCRVLGDARTTYADERKRLTRQVDEVSALLHDRPYVGGGRVTLHPRFRSDDSGADVLHREIRGLVSEGLDAERPGVVSDDDVTRLHDRLAKLVGRMRPDRGSLPRGFDPRASIEIGATIDMPDGTSVAADSTGARSGGESQTLMAFLTGAALLYALGATDGQPAYAPMIMDEAFSIADKEHTESASQAVIGLGFQLICVVAENKESDFEDAADIVYDVTKGADHRAKASTWKALR